MRKVIILLGTLLLVYLNGYAEKVQQNVDTLNYRVYKGRVIDAETREKLNFVSIVAKGTNIATISNNEGEFLLKIPNRVVVDSIEVTHIGYRNQKIACVNLKKRKNILRLKPVVVALNQINIYPLEAKQLVQGILKHLRENYTQKPNMMEGFYRETIRKNRNYVAISEAVVNIHKSGYGKGKKDQVHIFKGRKSRDVKRMDTLLFKLQGGPLMALQLDVVKNPQVIFAPSAINDYEFELKSITEINKRMHYVIGFKQKKEVEYPLYAGILYVESDKLALTGAKFNLNLENIEEARRIFVRKKPLGVKVTPVVAEYMVNYRETNGKWYFTYSRGYLKFRCNWRRKLFNSKYMLTTELAITDRDSNNIIRYKNKEKFKSNQVMVDELNGFVDVNFWGEHNTIEPEQSIQSAIRKLKRRAKRRQ